MASQAGGSRDAVGTGLAAGPAVPVSGSPGQTEKEPELEPESGRADGASFCLFGLLLHGEGHSWKEGAGGGRGLRGVSRLLLVQVFGSEWETPQHHALP